MSLLNFTAGEFFSLLAAAGGMITALYLLDRSKRKRVVSTLRFWIGASTADEQQRRKRVREPWSLVLQLISLLLLLLAAAQLQWDPRNTRGRDHVLLIDSSAWTAERTGNTQIIEREKDYARQYIGRLDSRDRVMVVRASALASPTTPFTADRAALAAAIAKVEPEYSVFSLREALSFAKQATQWSDGRSGEVVYVGPQMVDDLESQDSSPATLRVIEVPADLENCGIVRVGVTRIPGASRFDAVVTARNYGRHERSIVLYSGFARTNFAARPLLLPPGREVNTHFSFVAPIAGQFFARLSPGDALPLDDSARIDVPKPGNISVVAYSSRPDTLKPLFAADAQLSATFYLPSQYQARHSADIVIFDQFAPPDLPGTSSLLIAPPQGSSPVQIKEVAARTSILSWTTQGASDTGLRSHEIALDSAEVFHPSEGDLAIASAPEGPVVVERPNGTRGSKLAVIGFDPFASRLRAEVTTPLLFADLLHWLAPDAFRTFESVAEHVGVSTVALEDDERADHIRVSVNGREVPFTTRGRTLELFASRPEVVKILTDEHERTLSLTLPEIASNRWAPPPSVAAGLPPAQRSSRSAVELWRWLAVLGGMGLLIEWIFFGRRRAFARRPLDTPSARQVLNRQREAVIR